MPQSERPIGARCYPLESVERQIGGPDRRPDTLGVARSSVACIWSKSGVHPYEQRSACSGTADAGSRSSSRLKKNFDAIAIHAHKKLAVQLLTFRAHGTF